MYVDLEAAPFSFITISPDSLTIQKAIDFLKALKRAQFVSFVGCMELAENREIIILDAEVEVGQKRINDIRSVERMAVVFSGDDETFPDVLALRTDFPNVPHLNLREYDLPRSLCLYDVPYQEIKAQWTAISFLERIREWLAKTAKGELHQEEQPLEPLLQSTYGDLIIPAEILDENTEIPLLIRVVNETKDRLILELMRFNDADIMDEKTCKRLFFPVIIHIPPQTHGVIHRVPNTIYELAVLLEPTGFKLIDYLRTQLLTWNGYKNKKRILESNFIIILMLPKKRDASSEVEVVETRAVISLSSIKDVGNDLGVWGQVPGNEISEIGFLIGNFSKEGRETKLLQLNTIQAFSRNIASKASGIDSVCLKILALGMGALGSHIFNNLIRMGVGEWTLLDKDYLLPHNLARHTLTARSVGFSKAKCLSEFANDLYHNEHPVDYYDQDVFRIKENPELATRISEAQIILDATASNAVSREIVYGISSSARRVSAFLNPQGTDSIIIAEDKKRSNTLDNLEIQYYRSLINTPDLNKHLSGEAQKMRYAFSCSDISATIPQDIIALHGAICSRSLNNIMSNESAVIKIWRVDSDRLTINTFDIPIYTQVKLDSGSWTILTDDYVIKRLRTQRTSKLQNETGGVLIGSFDTSRKIIYIAESLDSPSDSIEWPKAYVRGSLGLKERLQQIKTTTLNQLQYVGEWHTHPEGFGVEMSRDDSIAMTSISEIMSGAGLPGVMLIIGAGGKLKFHVLENS